MCIIINYTVKCVKFNVVYETLKVVNCWEYYITENNWQNLGACNTYKLVLYSGIYDKPKIGLHAVKK